MVLNAVTPGAVTRARVEVSLGATITLIRDARSATDPAAGTRYYRVPARDGDHTYDVEVTGNANGATIQCCCKAGVHGKPCWHAGLAILALDGEVEVRQPTPLRRPASRPTVDELSMQPAV